MQSFDSGLHNADILHFIHNVREHSILQKTAFCPFVVGMNGLFPFDVKPGIKKRELLNGHFT